MLTLLAEKKRNAMARLDAARRQGLATMRSDEGFIVTCSAGYDSDEAQRTQTIEISQKQVPKRILSQTRSALIGSRTHFGCASAAQFTIRDPAPRARPSPVGRIVSQEVQLHNHNISKPPQPNEPH